MATQCQKSLADHFPNLDITHNSTMSAPFTKALHLTLKKTFPHWGSIRAPKFRATFTIKMDRNYDYSCGLDEDDPDEHFALTESLLQDVRDMMHNLSADQDIAFEDFLTQSLTSVVFGSNYVEDAGLGHDITFRICKEIFYDNVETSKIDIRTEEYQSVLENLAERGKEATDEVILRSRLEIVNHALALKHIITEMIIRNQPLTEQLIKTTHQILTKGIDTDDGDKSYTYSGIYRTVPVCAGYTNFMPPESVPLCMNRLVLDYNEDLTKAEQEEKLDPFYIAAKYGHKFVNIHPFVDGNGRTCRLILNAVVLKYAGILVDIGEQEGDREEYLEIAVKGNLQQEIFDEQDGEGKVPWGGLASFVIKKGCERMKTLRDKLKGGT